MTSEVMALPRAGAEAGAMTTTTTTAIRSESTGITHPMARPFLLADAATTGLNGLAYLGAAGWLADWFGASESLLRGLGAFLVLVAAGIVVLATRRPVRRRAVLGLVAINALWVVASLGYAVMGGLTALGTGWTVLQAVVVAVFAAGQVWFARKG